ncbi:helix-turn-helix domain-containing protein [uncultured Tenacibaculum sp.]|uniref:winged helix-turn-helix transcriptional regulator n=1 Tax=uncultured Tenacibaculum sp. TaxID=174713 RepID=UPI002609E897|nr:helix-turn-helix domain-containing protein [uncultured Tenacibaculum sp.]
MKCSQPLCPLTQALSVIGGKWKPLIIYYLDGSNKRFGQLDAIIPGISRKVLTTQLNELRRDKLIERKAYAETPPRVEYSLTSKGQELLPILNSIGSWGMYLVDKYKAESSGNKSED